MIIVNTGNGKGKTTAALGQALRAVGEKKKVIMIQFIKGPFKSGEDFSSKKLAPNFKLVKGGIGFVGILGDPYPREDHIKAAQKTWELCKKSVLSGKYDMVIMDEINVAMKLELIKESEVRDFLEKISNDADLVLTGRDAPKWLLKMADIATEMKEIKHSYQKGIKAKKGIEF